MADGVIVKVLLILVAATVLGAMVAYYATHKGAATTPEREKFQDATTTTKTTTTMAPQPLAPPLAQPLNPPPPLPPAPPPQPFESASTESLRPADDKPSGASTLADVYPSDRLSPDDLLPKDAANSKWAQVNPAGQGDLKDQNFLTAGYHLGVDTKGQSLRNASWDIRSAPVNPRVKVSIWNQSTVEPDLNRRPLE